MVSPEILSFIDNEIRECFFKRFTYTYDAEIIEIEGKDFIKRYVVIDALNPKKSNQKYKLEEVFLDFLKIDINSDDSIKTFVNKHGILNNFCIIKRSEYESYLLAKRNPLSHLYIIDANKTKAWKILSPNLFGFGVRGKAKFIGDFFYRDISPLIGRNLYIGELINTIPKDTNKMNFLRSTTHISENLEFSWKDMQDFAKDFCEKIKSNSKEPIDLLGEFPLNLFLIHFGGYLAYSYKDLNLINFNISIANKFIDSILEIFGKEYIGTKIKICLNCKEFFIPKNSKGIFCSDRCRYAYNKRK